MEDKELKKKLARIPDVDKNGDPIYKIAGTTTPANEPLTKLDRLKKTIQNNDRSKR